MMMMKGMKKKANLEFFQIVERKILCMFTTKNQYS